MAAAGRNSPEKRDRVTWDNGISHVRRPATTVTEAPLQLRFEPSDDRFAILALVLGLLLAFSASYSLWQTT
jgi:hypothetical protein